MDNFQNAPMISYHPVPYEAILAVNSSLKVSVCAALALAAAVMALLFVISVWKEQGLELRGHWGGFGSNSGGWWISRSLSFLFASIAFAALLALVSISNAFSQDETSTDKTTDLSISAHSSTDNSESPH
jgi:hypothetical protein